MKAFAFVDYSNFKILDPVNSLDMGDVMRQWTEPRIRVGRNHTMELGKDAMVKSYLANLSGNINKSRNTKPLS